MLVLIVFIIFFVIAIIRFSGFSRQIESNLLRTKDHAVTYIATF